jgi:hypothetical protein
MHHSDQKLNLSVKSYLINYDHNSPYPPPKINKKSITIYKIKNIYIAISSSSSYKVIKLSSYQVYKVYKVIKFIKL